MSFDPFPMDALAVDRPEQPEFFAVGGEQGAVVVMAWKDMKNDAPRTVQGECGSPKKRLEEV